jgi:hypothetical protein
VRCEKEAHVPSRASSAYGDVASVVIVHLAADAAATYAPRDPNRRSAADADARAHDLCETIHVSISFQRSTLAPVGTRVQKKKSA